MVTLPETNSSHQKNWVWNTILSFWDGPFSGAFAVSFREGNCWFGILFLGGKKPKVANPLHFHGSHESKPLGPRNVVDQQNMLLFVLYLLHLLHIDSPWLWLQYSWILVFYMNVYIYICICNMYIENSFN